ncbi:hypothetical protein V2J09_003766 [Rumex salicifolius]
MGFENLQNQGMNLILSTDARPRLKWTPELHMRFVDAVIQLGGAEKATPKSVRKAMGIPGLTLYHLKSHLQKYRLEKNQPTEACSDTKQDDRRGSLHFLVEEAEEQTSNPVYKSWQISQVQRKLHEQMEVQKHLQLRIEAQGKYLQKVLKKAQETLSTYTLSSMVNSGCSSPSLSDLTEETRPMILETYLDNQTQIKGNGFSTESSLTSSETLGAKEYKETKIQEDADANKSTHAPFVLDQCRKRKGSSTFDDREASKKLPTYKKYMGSRSNKMGFFGVLDLNSQYQEDQSLEQNTIDLNSIDRDQFHDETLILLKK